MFNLFGAIPDIVMGKNPFDALKDNALAVGGAMVGAPMLGAAGVSGAAAAGGAAGTASAPAAVPGLLTTIGEYAKPIGAAASAASSVKGLLDQHQMPIQSPMPMQQVGGSQALTQLAGQNQQSIDGQMQLAEQQRAQRRQMLRGGLL